MEAKLILLSLVLLSVLLRASAQQCPDLYKRFSSKHTFCLPPNTSCKILKRGVSDKDKQDILQIHNEYRNKVATGQERRAGGLPTAANMLEMIWDDEIASIAQKLADSCNYGHDCRNCRRVRAFSVGQNIGKSTGYKTAPDRADWNGFIQRLYEEVERFDKSYIKPFRPSPQGSKTPYGHFTQVVWATSWRVGCGWATYVEGGKILSYTVCNYGPAGNLRDGEMYQVGPTCSACPKNTCCGSSCSKSNIKSNYNGLCKVIDEKSAPEGDGPNDGVNYHLFCDFNNLQNDCDVSVIGKSWKRVGTRGGNFASTVLEGGEQTNLIFNKKIELQGRELMCLKLVVRTAPNVDGDDSRFQGTSTLDLGSWKPTFNLRIEWMPKELWQQFTPNTYKIRLVQDKEYTFQYSFQYSVPAGAKPQFVEIKEVSLADC